MDCVKNDVIRMKVSVRIRNGKNTVTFVPVSDGLSYDNPSETVLMYRRVFVMNL